MVHFSSEALAAWSGGVWTGGSVPSTYSGISIDTRTLKPGDLYVALKGSHLDGHAFIDKAFAAGACGAMVSEQYVGRTGPLLCVPDTLAGLQDLARGYRATWATRVIGLTGSVGKTTVKEMCSSVLAQAGNVHATEGNFNNHIGLPLTMLSLPEGTDFGVFEIGMSHPGEIAFLTELLQPEIGILTEIGSAHLENFSSVEGIAREKAALVAGLPKGGLAILDCGSEWYALIRSQVEARVTTLSFSEDGGDYVGHAVGDSTLEVGGASYVLPIPGEHTMKNAMRAVVLGSELGLSTAQIAAGLCIFQLPPMRWEISEIEGVCFVNDAYNANPLSMRSALTSFCEQGGGGQKWAVLGGMLELGPTAEVAHAELGAFVDTLELDGLITVGVLGNKIVSEKIGEVLQVDHVHQAARYLAVHLLPGDRVLLKASRSERLERVLSSFAAFKESGE